MGTIDCPPHRSIAIRPNNCHTISDHPLPRLSNATKWKQCEKPLFHWKNHQISLPLRNCTTTTTLPFTRIPPLLCLAAFSRCFPAPSDISTRRAKAPPSTAAYSSALSGADNAMVESLHHRLAILPSHTRVVQWLPGEAGSNSEDTEDT